MQLGVRLVRRNRDHKKMEEFTEQQNEIELETSRGMQLPTGGD